MQHKCGYNALSEEIAHPTVYHYYLSQISVNIQLNGLTKCKKDSGAADPGDFPFIQLEITWVSCIKTVHSANKIIKWMRIITISSDNQLN